MSVHGQASVADEDLVRRLAAARIDGSDIEDSELQGGVDRAHTVQLAVLRRLQDQGHRVSGWKVGLTSGAARDLMGAGVRPFGFLMAEHTFASGAVLPGGADMHLQIEPELCLEIGTDLKGADLPLETCRRAVRQVRAAFEINRMRVRMPGRNNLFVADGLGNWGVVLGEGMPVGTSIEVPRVALSIDGVQVSASPPGLPMDDPILSLSRLCTELDRYGLGLTAGQHVITGAFLRYDIARTGTYEARFDGVGAVSIDIV